MRMSRHGLVLQDTVRERLLLAGGSTRAEAMLIRMGRTCAWLDGRGYLIPEDLRGSWHEVMTHRLVLDPVFELRRHELGPRLLPQVLGRAAPPFPRAPPLSATTDRRRAPPRAPA